MLRRNVASQYIYFGLVNATTGAALTGATVTAVRSIGNGAQASCTGTTTDLGSGQYRFNLSQADTDGDYIGYFFTATNAIPVSISCTLTQANPTSATDFGITRLDAAVTSRMAAYTQPTGFLAATFPTGTIANTTNITAGTITTTTNLTNLPSIPANWLTAAGIAAGALNGKGNWNIGKTGYALTAGTGLGNQTANITGNVSGSVGSVTGSVGSVVGLTAANLDVAVSSRMATYTQPTGFLAATFPGTVASTTNITAASGVTLAAVTHTGAVIPTVSSVTGLNASNLDVAISTRQAAGAVTLTTAGSEAVADALLLRNIEGGSNVGRQVREALYALRNRVNATGTSLLVYRSDDVSVAWTGVLTLDGAAQPITQVDPA